MDKFKGILFTLKKRVENIVENDNDHYKYLVMGYYDGLDINIVDKWYAMRPRGLRELNLQVDISSPFADQYTMRAFFPEDRGELEKSGFNYKIWEEIGETELKEFGKPISDVRRKNPYICMSVVNIADPSLLDDNLSRIPEKLKKQLLESAANAGITLDKLNCAVFPSIGYADYIVLFLTYDLNLVSWILGGLRRDKEILISGIYSVCGIDSANVGCLDLEDCTDVQIALYINLREGISIGNFIHGLDNEITEAQKKNELPKEYIDELKSLRTELEENVYLTFGYSNSMIVLYKSLNTYKQLYAENHILNPGHAFFKKYIGNLKTSVRMKEKSVQPEASVDSIEKRESAAEREYDRFINQYSEFLEKNDFHIRSAIGLKQIMKNYLNITSLSRSFDIAVVLGKAFDALINAVMYYMNKPLTLPDEMEEEEEQAEEYKEKIRNEYRQTVEAVKLYKESIGDFIADLMRSDCAFIEGNILSHPAIGSATKLLFAYTGILNGLARKYGEDDRLQFIVISGGCDKTEAVDLFSFASSDEIENIKKLIIISIPEMSLYDAQGTLFRILHECMHFIGKRNRKERYRFIINALAAYIAFDISTIRFSAPLLMKYIGSACGRCDAALKRELAGMFEKSYKRAGACAEQEIAHIVKEYKLYKSYMDHDEDACYHKGEIFDNVLDFERFAESLAGKNDDDDLERDIYEILCARHVGLLESFTDTLQNLYEREKEKNLERACRLHESLQEFERQLNHYKYELKENGGDRITKGIVEDYFETFLYQALDGPMHLEWFYTAIVDSIVSAMVESYSDCTAISLTGMPVEDFLLSFIYELWDIDQAFPLVLSDCLRIGTDLSVMYGIKGDLGAEIENRIKNRVKRRKCEGYIYKHADEMIERINIILSQYQEVEFKGICENVEGYIKEILRYKPDAVYPELKEIYAKCAFDDNSESGYVYASINSMLNRWKELGIR